MLSYGANNWVYRPRHEVWRMHQDTNRRTQKLPTSQSKHAPPPPLPAPARPNVEPAERLLARARRDDRQVDLRDEYVRDARQLASKQELDFGTKRGCPYRRCSWSTVSTVFLYRWFLGLRHLKITERRMSIETATAEQAASKRETQVYDDDSVSVNLVLRAELRIVAANQCNIRSERGEGQKANMKMRLFLQQSTSLEVTGMLSYVYMVKNHKPRYQDHVEG
ncbi:uncharacterized protein LAESUDRAFT_715649 [Laetiporus sulphureus 93-53]|uniref:Uncharacterized protein n=1 Tax=Laetiporus sulphureus 93-53 TaxID=1314785 RepID=A0A165D8T4_9APHY|nr:uncharacterized protein LAESUDRAFT_715649 [Laetiporus sulphureus 93-53]KZT04351.1 hypothetical protein LAESUDRAFT_715649 [Laetiporus sulphureus 93-53]